MAIKELKDLITPTRMMSGDEDEIHDQRVNQVAGLGLIWHLKVSFHCGVNADECFEDPGKMTNLEKTVFKIKSSKAFDKAIEACTERKFETRLFRYDGDHPGAISTISYRIPLNAEQILALHDGAAHYDVVDIHRIEKWLNPESICKGAWISDEYHQTRLIKD